MAVRLRLTRLGAKKRPFYRVIATDSRTRRDGRYLENLGTYDPMSAEPAIKIDLARVDYWLGVGAQPSDTVRDLIAKVRAAGDAGAQTAQTARR